MHARGKTANGFSTSTQSYAFQGISTAFTLEEQEKAADRLVRQVIRRTDEILRSEMLNQEKNRLPDHLEKFRLEFEEMEKKKQSVKLPVILQVSPRSRKKISLLPPPNETEKQKLEEIEKYSRRIQPVSIYSKLETKTLMASEFDDSDVSNFYKNIDKLKARPHLPKNGGSAAIENSSTKYFENIASHVERKAYQIKKIDELLIGDKPIDSIQSPLSTKSKLNKTWNGKNDVSINNKRMIENDLLSQTSLSLKSLASIPPIVHEKIVASKTSYEAFKVEKLKVAEKLSKESEREFLNDFTVKVYDEMGVDLNKDYNRMRKYKNCIKTIMLHTYQARIAAGFAWWCIQTKKAIVALQHRAATKINQAMFAGMYRINKQEKKRLLREQLEAELERRRLRALLLNTKATIITLCVRRYVNRKMAAKRRAKLKVAVILQKRFRGWRARHFFITIFNRFNLCTKSATKIQTAYRRRLAMRLLRLTKKIDFVQKWLQSIKEMKAAKKIVFLRNGAELYIAKAYRTFTMRKKLHNLIFWHRFVKVVFLQRVFRGYRARKRCRLLDKQRKRQFVVETAAAILIQTAIRSFVARCKFGRLLEIREMRTEALYEKKLRYLAMKHNESIQRTLIKLLRKLKPFKYIRLNKKATIIQKVWRGHHAFVRCFYMRIRRKLNEDTQKYLRKYQAAVKIQKVVRGYLVRLKKKQSLQKVMVIKIQSFIRIFLSKMRVRRKKFIRSCARKIATNLFRFSKLRQFYLRRKYAAKVYHFVLRIQRLWRRCLGRRRFHSLKCKQRVAHDVSSFIKQRQTRLLSMIELRILVDTMNRSIGQKYSTLSGQDCPCHGPLQAIFVLAACSKGRADNAGLIANKLDAISLSKFAHKVQGFMVDGAPENGLFSGYKLSRLGSRAGSQRKLLPNKIKGNSGDDVSVASRDKSNDSKKVEIMDKSSAKPKASEAASKRKRKTVVTKVKINVNKTTKALLQFAILEEIKQSRLVLPQNQLKISPTELDIYFNKCKSDPFAGNMITYSDFVQCLNLCSKQIFALDKDAKGSVTISRNVGKEKVTVESDNESVSGSVSDGRKSLLKKNGSVGGKIAKNKKTFSFDRLTSPVAELLSSGFIMIKGKYSMLPNVPDYLLVLVIKIVITFMEDDFMEPVLKWLNIETQARLNYFIIKIQTQVRIRQAKSIRSALAVKYNEKQALFKNAKYAIKIQCFVRMHFSKQKTALLAQKIIVKYVPTAGEVYWYHRRTRVHYKNKPRILRGNECYSISVPEAGLENLAYCCYCNVMAEVNCNECEESMCKLCFDSLHCKGQRRNHVKVKIPFCGFCQYQVATKSCLTCVLHKPKPGTLQSALDPADRGTFCDSCFIHVHEKKRPPPRNTQQDQEAASKAKPSSSSGNKNSQNAAVTITVSDRRKGMQALMVSSREAYLIRHHIHEQLSTEHNYDNLVQTCEECGWRSSSWRCIDCKQVYCNKCLVGLHSIGGPFSRHRAELLPYYTPTMHISFSRDLNAIYTQEKLERIGREMSKRREQKEYVSAIAIQSWWRMILGKRLGKRHMKKRRRLVRSNYRFRKRETLAVRQTVFYKLRNVFGWAPKLASDTREESVLKAVSVFRRQQARLNIWKNIDDMDFSQLSGSLQRKGNPRRGFDLGEIDDLIDQAKKGGVRMPGLGLVTKGYSTVLTTCNLSDYISEGDMIRIKHRLFKVIAVRKVAIELDRRWLHGDLMEPGEEIIYRLPSVFDDDASERASIIKFNSFRHALYDIFWFNPLSQIGLSYYKRLLLRLISKFKKLEESSREAGNRDDEDLWADRITYLVDQAKWATGYLHNEASYVDLSGADLFEDDEKDADEKARKQQQQLWKKRSTSGKSDMGSEHDSEKSDKEEEEKEEVEEDGEVGEIATLLRRAKIKQKAKEQSKVGRSGERRMAFIGGTSGKIQPLSENGPNLPEDYGDEAAAIQEDANKVVFNTTATATSTTNAVKESVKTSTRKPNSLFSSATKQKQRLAMTQKGGSASKSTASEGFQDTKSEVDSTGKRPTFKQSSKFSRNASKRSAGDASTGESVAEYGDSNDNEMEGEVEVEEEGMSKAKMLQQKKKKQQTDGPKIAKRLTAKEKRALETANGRPPGVPWTATVEEQIARKEREDAMSVADLALEASEWKEMLDPITEKIYYQHVLTWETMTSIPRAVAAKKQLDFENSKNKKNFDEAQKRIARLELVTKERMLIYGGRIRK
mmetsp:Transcript_19751/g.27140  ORF Transcript_19751/g.27140 Transcript_19751/m.27140 type:complete len:2215 (+) Transcript_19751:40-6684(+)